MNIINMKKIKIDPIKKAIDAGYYNPYKHMNTKLSMNYVENLSDFESILIDNIQNDPDTREHQCRKDGYVTQNLQNIKNSIAAEGLKHPIFVKFIHENEKGIDIYRVVSGHHRYWAHRELKLKHIPCFVVTFSSVEQKLDFEQAENRDISPRTAHCMKDAIIYLKAKNDIGAFNEFGTSWEKGGGRYKEVMRLLDMFYSHMNSAKKGKIFKEFSRQVGHNSKIYDYDSKERIKEIERYGFNDLKPRTKVGEVSKKEIATAKVLDKKTNKTTVKKIERLIIPINARSQNLRTSLSELMIKIANNDLEYSNSDTIHCFITIDNPNPTTIKKKREKVIDEQIIIWNSIFYKLNFPLVEKVTFLKAVKATEKEHIEYKLNKDNFNFVQINE